MERPTQSNYREEGIEELLDFIEGAPRMDIFLRGIPYPASYLKNQEIEIPNIKLIKLMERGVIGQPRASVFFTDEPKFPAFFTAPLGEETLKEDQCGSSLDLVAEKAIVRAMAECIERLCLRSLHQRILGTYEELSKEYNLVNPSSIGVDKNTRVSWTEVFDVKNRNTVYIPSQLVYVPPNFSDFFGGEPITRLPTSNGAAYGDSYEMAIQHGLLEIIERDATMISWLARRKIPRITLDTKKTKELENYFSLHDLELNVFDATTNLEIPVMITIIRDRTGTGPAISFGAGSSLNPEEAAIKSILEAQQGRVWIRASYITERRPEIKPNEIVDIKTRCLYWYNKDKVKALDFLLECSEKKSLCSLVCQKNDSFKENVKVITNKLLEKGYSLFIADISTTDVKEVGSRAVKVICPELQPFYLNENYPVYSKRLESYLQEQVNKTPNKIPHPVI